MRLSLLTLMVLCFAPGCASYEYDITRPADLTGHIGTQSDQVFQRDGLEYRLRTVDSRLVLRLYNPTDQPLTLLGQRSSVVDPAGQSHPFASQTISPQSFIKLILPPARPRLERTGPSIGIGIGAIVGNPRRGRFYHSYSAFDTQPQYLVIYDDENALYWDWNGETTIRLSLVFQQAEKTIEHEFVIARHKSR